jgi:hypothetical protein
VKTIRIYRHPECKRCAKIVRLHHALDWLDRIEDTAQTPPGHTPLRKGEILVEDLRDGRWLEGIHAVRAIFRQIPLYFPLRLLLRIPYFAQRADEDARGLTGTCDRNKTSRCEP